MPCFKAAAALITICWNNPEFAVRAETEHAVAQNEDALASLVGHAERRTSDAECLVEIVQRRIGRAIWPGLLHRLFALDPVAGRDCEHLHELARFAQAPGSPEVVRQMPGWFRTIETAIPVPVPA
jgi:hypothetical protein